MIHLAYVPFLKKISNAYDLNIRFEKDQRWEGYYYIHLDRTSDCYGGDLNTALHVWRDILTYLIRLTKEYPELVNAKALLGQSEGMSLPCTILLKLDRSDLHMVKGVWGLWGLRTRLTLMQAVVFLRKYKKYHVTGQV